VLNFIEAEAGEFLPDLGVSSTLMTNL